MTHDRGHHPGPVSAALHDSERPQTSNRKYYGHVPFTAMAPVDRTVDSNFVGKVVSDCLYLAPIPTYAQRSGGRCAHGQNGSIPSFTFKVPLRLTVPGSGPLVGTALVCKDNNSTNAQLHFRVLFLITYVAVKSTTFSVVPTARRDR